MLCAIITLTTAFAPHLAAPSARAQHARARGTVISAAAATLQVVTDDSFDDIIMSATTPVVLDFAAEFCGPCKLVEPALKRLDMKTGVDVVKCRLEDKNNRELRTWLKSHDIKVTALPTLLLVKEGVPVRTLFGADKIMQESMLHAFAFDDAEPPPPPPTPEPDAHIFGNIFSKLRSRVFAF